MIINKYSHDFWCKCRINEQKNRIKYYTFQSKEFRKSFNIKLLCFKQRVIQQPTGDSPKAKVTAVPQPEDQARGPTRGTAM